MIQLKFLMGKLKEHDQKRSKMQSMIESKFYKNLDVYEVIFILV